EDRAEGGCNRVELAVQVRKLLAVALVEPDVQTLLPGCAARLGELIGGDVDADDVRARRAERHAAGPARDVEQAGAGAGRERRDHAVVNRREGLRDSLVARAAP